MNYTNLGTAGLRVSRICLGMMGFGNDSDRPWVIDEDAAEGIVKAAVEGGVTFFDTADTYSGGVSEQITGNLLRRLFTHRDDYVLATKVYFPAGADPTEAKPQSTGHLGPMPACQNERCPLTWDDGSCEASRTRFERTPCKCDCCIASRGPAHRSTTRISCRTPGWSR
jgi:aryl-alcohol dehydrogenase-like predicted oxidoreductase